MHLTIDPITASNYSDEEFQIKAQAALSKDITIRAVRGYAIVAFLPFRRFGQIVVPDRHQEESVEAIIVHDATGYGLVPGTKVVCSRGDGTYFEIEGIKFCRVKGKAMYAIDLA